MIYIGFAHRRGSKNNFYSKTLSVRPVVLLINVSEELSLLKHFELFGLNGISNIYSLYP